MKEYFNQLVLANEAYIQLQKMANDEYLQYMPNLQVFEFTILESLTSGKIDRIEKEEDETIIIYLSTSNHTHRIKIDKEKIEWVIDFNRKIEVNPLGRALLAKIILPKIKKYAFYIAFIKNQ